MLDDWTNGRLRPVRQPGRDGQAVRREGRHEHRGRDPPAGRWRRAWWACPATSRSAPTTRHPDQPDVRRRRPGRARGRGRARLRGRGVPRSTCSPTSAARDVTWNPSVVSVCKASLYCPTTEEYILPVIHGNDRVEWFVQLSDEIHWDVEDRDTGAARAKVVMKAGDVAAMPADIRHQGYSPKRSMLLVWENASPELPELIAYGHGLRSTRSTSEVARASDRVAARSRREPRPRRRHCGVRGVHPPHPSRRRARGHPAGPARPALSSG